MMKVPAARMLVTLAKSIKHSTSVFLAPKVVGTGLASIQHRKNIFQIEPSAQCQCLHMSEGSTIYAVQVAFCIADDDDESAAEKDIS